MKGKRVLKKQRNNDSLLGTYFVSLFSVMLCVVMLFGTTFAWFYTDNTSVGNEIHSGILKVDLLHVTAAGKISLKDDSRHVVFAEDDLWTLDKSTRTAKLEVLNTGNVTLNYKLDFVPVVNRAATVAVGDLFTVYVNENFVGTLEQLLSDGTGSEDKLCLITGQGLELGEADTIDIKIVMDVSRAQNFMGQKVPLYLKLEATQCLADAP